MGMGMDTVMSMGMRMSMSTDMDRGLHMDLDRLLEEGVPEVEFWVALLICIRKRRPHQHIRTWRKVSRHLTLVPVVMTSIQCPWAPSAVNPIILVGDILLVQLIRIRTIMILSIMVRTLTIMVEDRSTMSLMVGDMITIMAHTIMVEDRTTTLISSMNPEFMTPTIMVKGMATILSMAGDRIIVTIRRSIILLTLMATSPTAPTITSSRTTTVATTRGCFWNIHNIMATVVMIVALLVVVEPPSSKRRV